VGRFSDSTVPASFVCGFCGEVVETSVDPSAGAVQRYVEDCAVCCRPNVLHVTVDAEREEAEIQAELES
jgi:transcription elongation factor Elf1